MTPTFESAMLSFSPGVNSRAELVTLAPGLRPERRFAPLARGLRGCLHDPALPGCNEA